MLVSTMMTVQWMEADDAQDAALDAALSLLWELAQGKREGVGLVDTPVGSIDQAPITLADAGTDGENWTNTEYSESEILCVFDPNSIPARAG